MGIITRIQDYWNMGKDVPTLGAPFVVGVPAGYKRYVGKSKLWYDLKAHKISFAIGLTVLGVGVGYIHYHKNTLTSPVYEGILEKDFQLDYHGTSIQLSYIVDKGFFDDDYTFTCTIGETFNFVLIYDKEPQALISSASIDKTHLGTFVPESQKTLKKLERIVKAQELLPEKLEAFESTEPEKKLILDFDKSEFYDANGEQLSLDEAKLRAEEFIALTSSFLYCHELEQQKQIFTPVPGRLDLEGVIHLLSQ